MEVAQGFNTFYGIGRFITALRTALPCVHMVRNTKHTAPHYAVFSSLLIPFGSKYLPQHPTNIFNFFFT
jgi:hypothetical protein